MVRPPPGMPTFEFVILASLRAVQLTRGCTPRVEGPHKRVVIAQLEVASGLVGRSLIGDDAAREPVAKLQGYLTDPLPIELGA